MARPNYPIKYINQALPAGQGGAPHIYAIRAEGGVGVEPVEENL